MNEPELLKAAEATRGKFYTPLEALALLKDLPEALEDPPGHRSPHPALEYLARAGPVP